MWYNKSYTARKICRLYAKSKRITNSIEFCGRFGCNWHTICISDHDIKSWRWWKVKELGIIGLPMTVRPNYSTKCWPWGIKWMANNTCTLFFLSYCWILACHHHTIFRHIQHHIHQRYKTSEILHSIICGFFKIIMIHVCGSLEGYNFFATYNEFHWIYKNKEGQWTSKWLSKVWVSKTATFKSYQMSKLWNMRNNYKQIFDMIR